MDAFQPFYNDSEDLPCYILKKKLADEFHKPIKRNFQDDLRSVIVFSKDEIRSADFVDMLAFFFF